MVLRHSKTFTLSSNKTRGIILNDFIFLVEFFFSFFLFLLECFFPGIGNCKKLFFASIKEHRTYLVGNVSELCDRRRQFYCYVHALTVIFVFACFYFERQIFSVPVAFVCFRFHLRPEPRVQSHVRNVRVN